MERCILSPCLELWSPESEVVGIAMVPAQTAVVAIQPWQHLCKPRSISSSRQQGVWLTLVTSSPGLLQGDPKLGRCSRELLDSPACPLLIPQDFDINLSYLDIVNLGCRIDVVPRRPF